MKSFVPLVDGAGISESHPVRGAWIEMKQQRVGI